ncbi:MAG: helix-turn-helix transcriptional regulator [Candidatus Dojkabacteria bacterium]|nr:helix-turn-helix transcriptional regulator [Candidatus Dojkabacteria bacterium]
MKTTLGEKIKTARKEAKLSQLQLGVALKVSDKTISGYESNRISPPINKLQHIAELLKKPITYFLGVDERDYSIQARLRAVEIKLREIRQELREIRVISRKK